MDTLSPLSAPTKPGQIRLGSRLIQKDQPGGIEAPLSPLPTSPGPCDIRTLLLAGMQCLFLYVSPNLSSA